MKALLALVLIIASLQVAYTAQFNTAYPVSTTVTDYSFVSAPLSSLSLVDLNVSSAAATQTSTVTVNTYANLPTNFSASTSISINNGLPAGYTTIGGSILTGSIGAGLYVKFSSDIDGTVNASLIINPNIFTLGFNASILANFRPLYFDANIGAYQEFPVNQYTANANSGIVINFNRSTSIVLAVKLPNIVPILVNINNNAVAFANLVANASATLVVNSALTLYNLTAATGNLAIGVSSVAAYQGDNLIVSPIYSFTHSAGNNANVNVQLSYDLSGYNASIRANAAWYWNNNGNWERQSSSFNGNAVIYTTNHFSNWSVQSGSSSGAGAKLEVPSFIKLLSALF